MIEPNRDATEIEAVPGEPDRRDARAADRDVPQEGEALRHRLPAVPRTRLSAAGPAPPGCSEHSDSARVTPSSTSPAGPVTDFSLIEQLLIGPDGRIVGVDLTDAMLAQAEQRISDQGLAQHQPRASRRGRGFALPSRGSMRSSRHTPCRMCLNAETVIAHGAAALSRGGRWVILDLKVPDNAPRWPAQLGIAPTSRAIRLHRRVDRTPSVGRRFAWPMQDWLATISLLERSCSSERHSSPPGPAARGTETRASAS